MTSNNRKKRKREKGREGKTEMTSNNRKKKRREEERKMEDSEGK